MFCNGVILCYIKDISYVEDVWEQGAEGNICVYEGGSSKRLKEL
jgi:hypothetical protein